MLELKMGPQLLQDRRELSVIIGRFSYPFYSVNDQQLGNEKIYLRDKLWNLLVFLSFMLGDILRNFYDKFIIIMFIIIVDLI